MAHDECGNPVEQRVLQRQHFTLRSCLVSYSYMQFNSRVSCDEAKARAAQVKLLLMDVDGVLTSGHLFLVPDGNGGMAETKGFDSQDGIALQWLSWHGIKTGVISGRNSPATVERARQV